MLTPQKHPTQEWLAEGVLQAFSNSPKPKYLIRDRDCCYGGKYRQRLEELGIRDHVHREAIAVAKYVRRASNRDDPPRVPRSRNHHE